MFHIALNTVRSFVNVKFLQIFEWFLEGHFQKVKPPYNPANGFRGAGGHLEDLDGCSWGRFKQPGFRVLSSGWRDLFHLNHFSLDS